MDMKRPPPHSTNQTTQYRLVITTQNPQGGTRRRRVRPPPRSRRRHAPTPTRHLKRFIVSKGNRKPELILRSRVSAIRSRVRVFSTRYRFRPAPVPEPEDPYLTPDCRDLRPENVCPSTLSGLPMLPPLSSVSLWSTKPLSLRASNGSPLVPLPTCPRGHHRRLRPWR
jgi:hypothetical protein